MAPGPNEDANRPPVSGDVSTQGKVAATPMRRYIAHREWAGMTYSDRQRERNRENGAGIGVTMPRKKLAREAEMFRLALTGLPQEYYLQDDIPEKLAFLMDRCLDTANPAVNGAKPVTRRRRKRSQPENNSQES